MAEALAQVKTVMGHDAVILHTRTVSRRYWLGMRRREIVEITAGKGLSVPTRRRPVGRPPQVVNYLKGANGSAPVVKPLAAPVASSAAPATFNEGRQKLLETPAAGTAVLMGLSQEVASLKLMVKDLVTHERQKSAPNVPDELFDHYLHLIESQVADEIAMDILKSVRENVRAEHLRDADIVNEKIAEQLERLLPVAGPITRTKLMGPHVVALIGPTGVGKTTTLAKLAANLKLREQRRVGMITLDTYRIAAIDQLTKYAEIIGSRIEAVNTPAELKRAIESMRDCEYILIDTAGRSPNDTMKLNELKKLLEAAGPEGPDEVHLVLSTTSSQACVELAINRFSNVRVDKIIFTKLDEAAHVGVVLNVVRKVNKSLSYVTTGQDVPNDIEVGKARNLARRILGTST